MSHILRYIFVIAVAYDGRRLSPRSHTLVRVRLPDKLSEHDCLLFISFFNFWISQHNCAGVGHAKAAACRCGWVVSNMGLGTGLAGGFTYIRCESRKKGHRQMEEATK